MAQEIQLHNFLKENILDVVSQKHNYNPTCLDYLENTEKDLMLTLAFVSSTKEVMLRIQELQQPKNLEL
tara:strand:+ start:219 stop:425 length:207 start_codon:yes stop_codon:yes gene_type:complete